MPTHASNFFAGPVRPLTDTASYVLSLANRESDRLGCQDIHTGHLLTALVKEGSSIAWSVLVTLSGSAQDVIAVAEDCGKRRSVAGRSDSAESMNRVLIRASLEAELRNHRYIGPEHLLLSVSQLQGCAADEALTDLHIQHSQIVREVGRLLGEDAADAVAPDAVILKLPYPVPAGYAATGEFRSPVPGDTVYSHGLPARITSVSGDGQGTEQIILRRLPAPPTDVVLTGEEAAFVGGLLKITVLDGDKRQREVRKRVLYKLYGGV